MRKKRLLAGLVCAVLALTLGASLYCLIQYSGHDCHSALCQDCQLLLKCRLLFLLLGVGVLLPGLRRLGTPMRFIRSLTAPRRREGTTLVSLKVKLSD